MDWESYKGGVYFYEASTASLNWNKEKKAEGKILEEKTFKKEHFTFCKIYGPSFFWKKKSEIIKVNYFFSPALALKRDHLGRDILFK